MEPFFHLSYYFTTRPNPDFPYTTAVVALIVLLLAGAFALSWYRKKTLKDEIARKTKEGKEENERYRTRKCPSGGVP